MAGFVSRDVTDTHANQVNNRNIGIQFVLIQRTRVIRRPTEYVQQSHRCLFCFKISDIDRLGDTDNCDSKFFYRPTDDHTADIGQSERVVVVSAIKNFDVEIAGVSRCVEIPIVAQQAYVSR